MSFINDLNGSSVTEFLKEEIDCLFVIAIPSMTYTNEEVSIGKGLYLLEKPFVKVFYIYKSIALEEFAIKHNADANVFARINSNNEILFRSQ
jgi:hypothetical protein